MASPRRFSEGMTASLEDRDSEEEIFVRKKAKSKKVLQDSESEDGEDGGSFVQNDTLGGDKENGEEKETIAAPRNKKSHRIRQGLLDSDDSDTGDRLQIENLETSRKSDLPENEVEEERLLKSGKKYRKHKQHKHDFEEKTGKKAVVKSRRRKEKERQIESIKQLKKEKKPRAEVEGGERYPFNDSGCLLDDKDLFDNGLEEEDDNPPEDEESIESIRAAVKNKIKKYKNKERFSEGEGYKHVFDDENEEPLLKEPKRKERKAARLSKEAIKQLHSETQRLIRESSVSLPYHVPETKSIHDFFKGRPRPVCQGNAMALLKSTKYQLSLSEESADTKSLSTDCKDGQIDGDQSAANEPETSTGRDVDTTANKPLADAEKNSTEDSAEKPRQDSDNSCTVRTGTTDDNTGEQQHSDFLSTDCSEQKENEIPRAVGGDALEQRGETAPDVQHEKSNQVGPGLVTQPEKVRKSKLDKLRELGIDLSIKPRICSGNESFINLDESDSNKELEALKARFLKHTLQTSKSKVERTINMNIIRKETTSEGKEELKADVVPAVLAAESLDETVHTKPGEKLQVLKAKLQEAMKLRRTEERQKRQALFKLDNEDMLEEEEEEEEEEMTDESEEEEEGNHENAEFLLGEAEEDNEDAEEKLVEDGDKETDKESIDGEKLEKSVHCDSVPKPPSTESTLMLFKDSSSKMGYSFPDEKLEMEEAADKGPAKLEDDDSFSLPTLAKENSHNSSFEFIGSMIPSYQPCNKHVSRGGNVLSAAGFRSPSPGFFKTSFISSASKSSGKTSEPSLPIEDSQDLYNPSPEPKSLFPGAGESQFQFSLEDDTQSQLLDADGFLNVGQHRNKYQSSKHQLTLASMDENAMDANMDELLDLCSGQFTSQAEHVPSTSSNKKQNMEELLSLCSGKFVSQTGSPTWASSVSSKAEKDSDIEDPMAEALALCSGSFPTDREEEEEEEQEEFGDFQLLTDDNAFDSEEDEKSGDSDAEEAELSDDDDDDDDEELLRRRQGLKKKLKLQDFMEDEAELSGSDVGSEDEYDGEDLNEYEEEIIDEELPSEVELENQIQKFHMKAMLDDDKRQLRLYQERYLIDGDLHSDGPGRMRRFRWKNIDDASQMDLFQRDSDNDDENEQFDETEAKWRKERFEREQWLREQKEKNKEGEEEEEEEIGEDSQFMKLAKKVTAKSLQKKASPAAVVQDTALIPRNPFEAFRPASDIQIKSGSLLNRPKAVLQKLAAMSDLNPNAPRNSRNFVFHTLSPDKSEEAKEKSKLQVKKRGPPAAITSLAKRPRVESTEETSQSRSIFQYLES
ncbi:claspin isoform 2-T2 [Podargus strigoides]